MSAKPREWSYNFLEWFISCSQMSQGSFYIFDVWQTLELELRRESKFFTSTTEAFVQRRQDAGAQIDFESLE